MPIEVAESLKSLRKSVGRNAGLDPL